MNNLPRGAKAVPADVPTLTPGATLPAPKLPATVTNAGQYTIGVEVGPRGLQLVAVSNGSVVARSGWTLDASMAWASLGVALTPSVAYVANRAVNPARRGDI